MKYPIRFIVSVVSFLSMTAILWLEIFRMIENTFVVVVFVFFLVMFVIALVSPINETK